MARADGESRSRRQGRVEGEKRSWLRSLQGREYRRALFSFEMLLRAMDRFFNLDNHPRFQRDPPTPDCDFKVEAAIAEHTLRELIQLSQAVLNEADTSAFMFQSYVETELLSDLDRDELLERHRRQASPLESLYLLRVGLESLSSVTAAISAADRVSLATFRGLGHQYVSILLHNRYFSPYRGRGFNPVYDRVRHPLLRRAVNSAASRGVRRGLSLIILMLGRYLRIVGWLDPHATSRLRVQSALPYLTLLRSDFRGLLPYLDDGLPRELFPRGPNTEVEEEMEVFIDAFAFQLERESRKVFEQLLAGFPGDDTAKLQSALESAKGLLNTFLQQSVVSAVQLLLPEAEGKDVFPDFTSRREQSLQLRADIWTFHELLGVVSPVVASADMTPESKRRVFLALVEFVDHFERRALPGVRLADLEDFRRFFDKVRSLRHKAFTSTSHSLEVARFLEVFRVFLQTTLELVGKRSDLHAQPFDDEEPRRVLGQFLPSLDEPLPGARRLSPADTQPIARP